MPMGRAFPRLRPVMRQKNKLRFLLIYADPDQNFAAAEREFDKVKSPLDPESRNSADDIEVTALRGEDVTGDKLNKALLTGRYDVIHFAGHAQFSEVDPDPSGLVLHNHERFLSQRIQRIVEGQPLVFPDACQTAEPQRGRTAERWRLLLETCGGTRLSLPLRRGSRMGRIAMAGVRRPRSGIRDRVLQPGFWEGRCSARPCGWLGGPPARGTRTRLPGPRSSSSVIRPTDW